MLELQAAVEQSRPGSASLPAMLSDCSVTTAFPGSASENIKRHTTSNGTENTLQH